MTDRDDPTGVPEPSTADWETLTLIPPEGMDRTRWLSVDRDHCIPRGECR